MSLESILSINTLSFEKQTVSALTEERLRAILPEARKAVAFYRAYPDKFVDWLCSLYNPSNFKLYFYQRVFLREAMRHRYIYATFPRAYGKSFMAFLVLILRCIFYPNSRLFVTTGGKVMTIATYCYN